MKPHPASAIPHSILLNASVENHYTKFNFHYTLFNIDHLIQPHPVSLTSFNIDALFHISYTPHITHPASIPSFQQHLLPRQAPTIPNRTSIISFNISCTSSGIFYLIQHRLCLVQQLIYLIQQLSNLVRHLLSHFNISYLVQHLFSHSTSHVPQWASHIPRPASILSFRQHILPNRASTIHNLTSIISYTSLNISHTSSGIYCLFQHLIYLIEHLTYLIGHLSHFNISSLVMHLLYLI